MATQAAGVINPNGTCQLSSMPWLVGAAANPASGRPNRCPDRSFSAR